MRKYNLIKLQQWEEIVGFLKGFENSKEGTVTLIVEINNTFVRIDLPALYDMTKYRALMNRKVGILKTDDPQRPYLVRVMGASKNFASKERRL